MFFSTALALKEVTQLAAIIVEHSQTGQLALALSVHVDVISVAEPQPLPVAAAPISMEEAGKDSHPISL